MSSGFRIIVFATILTGLAGYAITWFVYKEIGPSQYAQFAVFWSALYLLIGAFSGIQQEITRASSRRVHLETPQSIFLSRFAAFATLGISIFVLVLAAIFSHQIFGETQRGFVIPLSIGVGAYVATAIISGALYGLSKWKILASMMVIDAFFRLATVGWGALSGTSTEILAWLVVAPFVATPLLLFILLTRTLRGKVQLDSNYRTLARNSFATVGASFLTAMVVSGFPMLLGVFSVGSPSELLGEVIYVITLTRAPLVVAVAALQSLLIMRFKPQNNSSLKFVVVVQVLVIAATIFLGFIVYWFGIALFEIVTGGPLTVSVMFLITVVISSGLLAMMTVFGAALLARGNHAAYVMGWFIVAAFTVIALNFSGGLIERASYALVLAPALGILTQLLFLFIPSGSKQKTVST